MPQALQNPPDNRWLFQLGREAELSYAELSAFFKRQKIRSSLVKIVGNSLLATADIDDPKQCIAELGGIIKIARIIDAASDADSTAKYLSAAILTGKLNFSISGETNKDFGLKVKKILKAQGRLARYIEPKNTATILHNKLVESKTDLNFVDGQIYATEAIQPIEELSKRDFGRPKRDDRSGMLPPKLAIMLINLGEADTDGTILDPFCGSGTILTEAALLGYKNIIGSDNSEKAISDSRVNIEWLRQNYPQVKANISTMEADITRLSEKFGEKKVDAIVTEPYMGRPLRGSETLAELTAEAALLKKLYLTAFEQFNKILNKNGRIVFVFPEFESRDKKISTDCSQEIQKMGFIPYPLLKNAVCLNYKRPGQRVSRRICRFIKK